MFGTASVPDRRPCSCRPPMMKGGSLAQIIWIKFAVSIYLQPRYFTAKFIKMLAEFSHCFVFDAGRDDVPLARVLFEEAPNRPVIGFRAAGSENNLVRMIGAQKERDLFARVLNRLAHLPAKFMC